MTKDMDFAGHLLVVDDHDLNRELLKGRLELEGYQVVTVGDGQACLDLIHKESFDALLLDIMMPGISGLECLTKLRADFDLFELPVLMVTGKDRPEDIAEALSLGANDYVTKPLEMTILIARLERMLQFGRLESERKRLSQSRDEFLAIASHDIRSPLQAIIGFAHVLQRQLKVGEAVTEESLDLISRIHNCGDMANQMVEDYVDQQSVTEGRIDLDQTRFDLQKLVDETVDSFGEQAIQKQIRFEVNKESSPIFADRRRIEQVLRNFISNALKFSPTDSVVTISCLKRDDSVFVEVSDQGPGLTGEDLKKAFQKYSRLSAKPTAGEKSSGLGLWICQELMSLHEGEIGAKNNGSKTGACFWFSLKQGLENSCDDETTNAKNGDCPEKTYSFLVVDDDKVIQMVTSSIIKLLGHNATCVSSGSAALAILQEQSFDIVFIDCYMPGMDGFQVASKIRALEDPCKSIPIVAMSAGVFSDHSKHWRDAGMNGFVDKPVRVTDVKKSLRFIGSDERS